MRNKRHIVGWMRTAALLFIVSACERGPLADEVVRSVDSAGVRLSTIALDSSSLPEWRLAPAPDFVITGAESGDSSAFSLVGAVRMLSDRSLVVADLGVPHLLVFDSSGRYQRALGRRGAGPGEFRNIASLNVLPDDRITIFDGSLRRLSIWHPTGYVRQIGFTDIGTLEAWAADAWIWRDSLVVVLQLAITPRPAIPAGASVTRWPMRAVLTLRDSAGRLLRSSTEFDGMYSGIYREGDTRLPFSHQPVVALSRDHVYFGSGADFRLSYVGPDFEPVGELRWPRIEEPLRSAEVSQVRDEVYQRLVVRMPPERARERIAMNFHPEILPRTRPAIGRVFVDADEQLWVERFEALRLGLRMQKPASSWIILGKDGRPIARLSLPSDTRLEAIRGDKVAVVQGDSLDVETVAVYSLSRSGARERSNGSDTLSH